MDGGNLTPISRPTTVSVKVDPTLKECESDGFGFPNFRLLRKLDRVVLCTENLNVGSPFAYRLFAIANTKGWFVAATNTGLILSPLSELQKALESDDAQPVFKPQKTIAFSAQPITLAFACNETRFLVGLAHGEVLLYDVDKLFSPGSDDAPLHALRTSNSPARQIVPNPSNDPALADCIAIVRFDGNVEVVNTQFQSQGGWTAREHDALPVAASWSPKGKQLAIGLRLGDILTYTLNDKATPQKHIPPTAQKSTLVSLDWLSGGFTFRTSYAPSNPEADVSTQHVVHLDTRQGTVTTTDLTHPFRSSERLNQVAHVVVLPRWDDENVNAESTKGLLVVGDMSSTDLEIFGHNSNTWYCYYQENPLSIPLNKEQEDTVLLSLAVDLVNGTGNPIMYAYLNDGTIQGWYMGHSKPYAGMVTGTAAIPQSTSQPVSVSPQQSSAFGQIQQSAFGQSSFGQASSTPSSAFGQASSAFAQPSSTSAFGQSPFGQSSAFGSSSAFGGNSTSAFGQTSSPGFGASSSGAFGSGTGFGSLTTTAVNSSSQEISMADDAPSFGGLSLGNSNDPKPQSTPGGGMFGSPAPLPLPPNHPVNNTSSQPSTISDSSGSAIRPATGFGAFGGGSFGEDSPFSRANSTPSTSAFATALSKPAEPPVSAFGQTSFAKPAGGDASKSAFGQPAFGQPAFGRPAFGQPAFGQSGFQRPVAPTVSAAPAKSSGGFSAFASAPSAFGVVSGTPTASTSSTKTAGGFGGFASGGPSAFGNTSSLRSTPTEPPKSVSDTPEAPKISAFGGGGSSVGTTGPSVVDSSSNAPSSPSPFGTPSKPSPFGESPFASGISPFGPQRTGISPETKSPAPIASPPNSPPSEPSSPSPFASSSQPAPTTGAFANMKSSAFQPAAGFGAFGASSPDTSSPFFKAAANQAPSVSAFSNLQTAPTKPPTASSTASSGSPSALGAQKSAFAPLSSTSTPTFGSPSRLGAKQSAFPPLSSSPSVSPTPAKPSIGGFAAYTSSVSPFDKIPASQSSFSDMLKGKDATSVESVKTSPSPSTPVKEEEASSSKPSTPVAAPSPSTAESRTKTEPEVPEIPTPAASAPTTPPSTVDDTLKDKGKGPAQETTQVESTAASSETEGLSKDASLSSVASSYVDVSQEETLGDGNVSDDAYRDGADDDDDSGSFLSESISSTAGEDDEDYVPSDSEAEEERSPTPSQVPLPQSRSQSSTPQPESGTPPPVASLSTEPILPPIKEESTTPPDSPEKQPSAAPPPTPAASLGLRRPNTRPVRSSPLANAVVGGDEEQDEEGKKEIPVVPKPRPASPKAPFGILPLKPSVEETATPSKDMRPRTPPLLSTIGGGSGSLFGGKPATSIPKPSPLATTSASSSTFVSAFAPSSGAGAAAAKPSMPPSPLPGGSIFGKPLAPGPAPTLPATPFTPPPATMFAKPVAQPAQPTQPVTPTPPPKPAQPAQSFQEGMQQECAILCVSMAKELEHLQHLATKATQESEVLNRKTGGSRLKADLGIPSRWYPADALKFRETLLGFADDLDFLKEGRDEAKKVLKELGSGVVKANTRKEEIERFNRAKEDDSFAKMLRGRTLGPEHLETRARLRGELMRRKAEVSKLENVLKEYKKKVSSMKSCKGVFRAPSLDTVNRTYRNIDIAIQQERDAIDRLGQKLSRIDLNTPRSFASKRDPRLPEPLSRPRAILPQAAVTTAAALNAERSAQKLKRALLGLRKEPLLNQPKANAPTPPVAFLSASQASGSTKESVVFNTPIKIEGPLFGKGGADDSSFGTGFEFPDDDDSFHLSTPVPTGRRGAGGGKKHGGGFFKKGLSATVTPPKAPSFDWGPLPAFDYGKPGNSGSPLVMGISGGPRK